MDNADETFREMPESDGSRLSKRGGAAPEFVLELLARMDLEPPNLPTRPGGPGISVARKLLAGLWKGRVVLLLLALIMVGGMAVFARTQHTAARGERDVLSASLAEAQRSLVEAEQHARDAESDAVRCRADLADARRTLDIESTQRRQLERQLMQAVSFGEGLDKRLSLLRPTELELREGLLVSYVPSSAPFAEAEGEVKVHIRNVQFACQLHWTVAAETTVKDLPAGDSELTLPAGKPTMLFCRPLHTAGWLQAVQIYIRRGDNPPQRLGSALGKIPLQLEDKDDVVVYFEQPIPPWNAVCIPMETEWLMVTSERPWAAYDTEKWLRGDWKRSEELPNTALFWAREGDAGMARGLAEFFVAHRGEPGRWGRFRNQMHVGITVRAERDAVSPRMRAISVEQLTKTIQGAFELLRRQRPPIGPSLEEEIQAAAKTLKEKR